MGIESNRAADVGGESALARRRRRAPPLWIAVWGRVLTQKPLAASGMVVVALFLFLGVFANFIARDDYHDQHVERLREVQGDAGYAVVQYVGPTLRPFYPLGLDERGRDVLSLLIYGARISMIVAFGTVTMSISLATIVGMSSAWFGGKIDVAIQRIVDGVMTFPWLVVLLVIVNTLPNKPPIAVLDTAQWGMAKVIITLGVVNVAWVSRVIRSAALTTKENQYVEAARAIGASGLRINYLHILPNIMAPIITLATLSLGYAILSEATLSFLGQGIPPPNPSWGVLLSFTGRQYLFRAPWMAISPGLVITIVVFAINVLGDGLRDLLDPRLKGAVGSYQT